MQQQRQAKKQVLGEKTQTDDNSGAISPPGTSKEKYGTLEEDDGMDGEQVLESGEVQQSYHSKNRRQHIFSEG